MSPLLEVKNLAKHFVVYHRTGKKVKVKALNNVSFDLEPGRVLGIVGESGSGKTTLGRLLMGIYKPDNGNVVFKGKPFSVFGDDDWGMFRKQVQPVFQDPVSAFNPVMTVQDIVREPLDIHNLGFPDSRNRRVSDVLRQCRIDPEMAQRKPSKLSGGQRQRVGIARALITEPEIMIADEPVSALDKPTSERIQTLLSGLISEKQMALIFITHDIAAVEDICDDIVVIYEGYMVESGSVKDVFEYPAHPYTKLLIDSYLNYSKDSMLCNAMVRKMDGQTDKGCPFRFNCPDEKGLCASDFPEYKTENGRSILCHFDPLNVLK